MRSARLICSVIVSLVAPGVLGTTFLVPSDRQMIERSDVIVAGTVIDSTPELRDRVVTRVRIATDEVLKGSVSGSTVEIVEDGGVLENRANWIYGTPVYQPGERVVVFLDRSAATEFRTAGMLLGKFTMTVAPTGEHLLVRGSSDHSVNGFTEDWKEHEELPRYEGRLLRYVRDSVRGVPAAADYFGDRQLQMAVEKRLRVRSDAAGSSYAMAPAARWNNGATAAIPTNLNGAPGTKDWVGAVQRGAGAWNADAGSDINYSVTGTSTSAFNQGDGSNVVIFNRPSGEFGGAVGIGGWAGGATHSFGGEFWVTITELDVKLSDALNAQSQSIIDAVMCHELGHTLGFRHSDEAGRSPNSSDAIMKAILSGPSGATLGSWDREAAAAVYGSGAPVCTPSSIVGAPTATPGSVNAGQNATLNVNAAGTAPLTFAWFRGSLGDTSVPVGNTQAVSVGPINSNTTYWVKVTNSCNASGASAAVTVNLAVCTPPAISASPTNKSIIAGQSTVLSVVATGSNLSYQWFQGPAGNTSNPVPASNAPAISVAPSTTTTYWVRVSSGCSSARADSGEATVTVGACVPVAITTQPSSRSINSGQSTTLTVVANGTEPITYQWFRGQTGDTSNPVGTSQSLTVNPTTATSYWVRVSGQCGTPVNSATATVSINLPCTGPPTITQQPAARAIKAGETATLTVTAIGGGLSYQWFRIENGGFVLLNGATTSTLTTPALTETTSYLVQVSNACGTQANSNVVTVTVEEKGSRRRAVRR